jgi:hypothetical protein
LTTTSKDASLMITSDESAIMSSFLMNSGSYAGADPKSFGLTAEDYHSQASAASAASAGYMTHGDYYAQHAAAASHYQGYPASMGLNNQQAGLAAAASYSRDMTYGGYYQHSGISPHHQQMLQHQMQQVASAGGHLSPLNPTAASHLSNVARSPVASPQPQSQLQQNLVNNVLNHGGGPHEGNGNSSSQGGNGGDVGVGDGYPSPQHPNVVPQPLLTPGGGGDAMSSDCSDDESSPQSGRQMPVVYPWMKKIHVGGVGKKTMTNDD